MQNKENRDIDMAKIMLRKKIKRKFVYIKDSF